jgi:hypothetical protein
MCGVWSTAMMMRAGSRQYGFERSLVLPLAQEGLNIADHAVRPNLETFYSWLLLGRRRTSQRSHGGD